MRIGIDIDETVALTNDLLIEKAVVYDKDHFKGKGFKDKNKYSFTDMFYWDNLMTKEYIEYFSLHYIDIIKPRLDALKVINKLYDEGNYICFITYRQFKDNYNKTKKWLDKHGFKYHKLITNSGLKGSVCNRENIDLFIDDSLRQVLSASDYGIKSLLIDTIYNRDYQEIKRISNWDQIYEEVEDMLWAKK